MLTPLVSEIQINNNLRRTAKLGYISIISSAEIQYLSTKYFGIYEDDVLVGYECPYSGKILKSSAEIVLEHIIPVNSKGGTVLFNCIPTSKGVNGPGQKGAKHLIDWWTSSPYWDLQAPARLEKIVKYMLEAYEIVFNEHTIKEIEESYLDVNLEVDTANEESDLTIRDEDESKVLKEQVSHNGIHSYLGFIISCIKTLRENDIDIILLEEKVKQLEDKKIFKNIEEYQLYQNILEDIIISKVGKKKRSYLTYLLNIDINKLMKTIKSKNIEKIKEEIQGRINNIEKILKSNGLNILDYFKSVKDIVDIDLLYKKESAITENDINIFIKNIKLGINSKIEIFIEMLNKGDKTSQEILKQDNKEIFDGYPTMLIGSFYQRNKQVIIQRLFEELKDNPKYDTARQVVLSYYKVTSIEEYYEKRVQQEDLNYDKRIEIFIEMLNKGDEKSRNILMARTKEAFEGYPNTLIGNFWSHNNRAIIYRLFEELKDNPKYNTARQVVLSYNKVSSIEEYYEKRVQQENLNYDKRIEIFIEMLNKGNEKSKKILVFGNSEMFEGYPNILVGAFWSHNKQAIIYRLFEELKDNHEYDTARQVVLSYNKVSSIEEYYEKEKKKAELRELKKKKKRLELIENSLNEKLEVQRRMA